jgi:hypothetical protein
VTVSQRAAIDFNSSRNVSNAIALVIERQRAATAPAEATHACSASGYVGRQLFYYTRSEPAPVPYWRHVQDYRRAHGVWYGIWLPAAFGERVIVPALRALLRWRAHLPLASSLLYLLDVSSCEHNADNSLFRSAYPELASHEESIYEAFVRLRARQKDHVRRGGGGRSLARTRLAYSPLLLVPMLTALLAVFLALLLAATTPASVLSDGSRPTLLAALLSPPPPPPPPRPWWSVA